MQEAEVSSLQRLTCHLISQLVPAAKEERDNCSISSGASGQIDYYFVSLKRLNNCDFDYATKKNPHTWGGISAHGFFLQVGSLCLNSRDKVRVVSHLLLQSLQEGEICGISRPQTLFILHMIGLQHRVYFVPVPMHRLQTLAHTHQYGYNPSVFLLNQVTDDLVVEELNWLPLGQSSQSINLPSSVITHLLQFCLTLTQLPLFPQLHTLPAQPSVWAGWKVAAAFHCSSLYRTVRNWEEAHLHLSWVNFIQYNV